MVDLEGQVRGIVLSCTKAMGIGRHAERVFSIASPDGPDGWQPHGLSCGFVKVDMALAAGRIVRLEDRHRSIQVEIVNDIRPARSARKPTCNVQPQTGCILDRTGTQCTHVMQNAFSFALAIGMREMARRLASAIFTFPITLYPSVSDDPFGQPNFD